MKVTRTFDLLDRFLQNPETLGKFKIGYKKDGKWSEYNVNEYVELSNFVSYGLLAQGIKKGDKIGIITNNRPEWNFTTMGISQVGAVVVPIYTTLSLSDFHYIITHSELKMLFVSDKSLYEKLKPLVAQIQTIQAIFTFDNIPDVPNWSELVTLGQKSKVYYEKELLEIKSGISTDDLYTIIYTSGTTGSSKGVMLSHGNITSNAVSSGKILHMDYNHKVLSFLPLSHVFEHTTNYNYQVNGISIYYAENMGTIASDIKELQVDGFITVPRLLEAIYEKIQSKAKNLKGLKKIIFDWAMQLAYQYEPYENSKIYQLKHKIADKLVFSKWREALSKKIIFIGCGGSAVQPRLAKVFWAAGLPVFEGYGLTETSPILAVNYYKRGKIKIGTTGTIFENVQIKIAEDGEILAKGPNVMKGYYKDPEQTAMVIDKDGWFHTGDIGTLVDNVYLKITDRKKEIFKMSNGKYIAPQLIENKLKESFFVGNSMVVGENQKFASALISPNFNKLKEWCNAQKIKFHDYQELISTPKVRQHFQAEIEKLNKSLGTFEQIRKFKLVCDEWTTQSGELSPSLKLKRRVIYEKYKDIVESIYKAKQS